MTRRLPPTWLLGLANLPFSVASTVLLITVPQLLAARHVPEPAIASITAFALIPGFAAFLVAPVLDIWVSRRSWAVLMACATAALTFAALCRLSDLVALRWLLFLATLAAALFQGALGGWLGSIVPKEDEARLGAWFTVANIAGFGIDAVVNITLWRALPEPFGAAAICALMLTPLLLMTIIPAPGPDRRLAAESFGRFSADLAAMLRRPSVLRTLAVFALPAACFSLTNMLGGIGAEFGAGERLVGLTAGLGVTVAGLIGSLGVPPLVRRFGPYRLYVAIAALGGLFSMGLALLARTPASFALAMVGENIAQAAAFTTANAITFRTVGKDNPLAATEFTVLTSAVLLPLSYMQWLDGRAFAAAGLTGAVLTDGGLGIAGAGAMVLLLARRRCEGPAPMPA